MAASSLETAVVHDTLGQHNHTHVAGIFGPNPGVLRNVGSPLRENYLAPMLRGEKSGAFGFTEPRNATSPTSGRVDGDTLIVSGQKSYVTGGATADFINTMVDVEGRGRVMVIIDRTLPGVEIKEQFETEDGSRHAYIQFNGVQVPMAHIVGSPGKGASVAMGAIASVRLVLASQSVGLCQWVINYTKETLNRPTQDGTTLGSKEGVRLRYADMRIKTYAARSMVYRTARLADAGENVVNELMATKVFSTETVGQVIDTAIQLYGGRAIESKHPLTQLASRIRAWRFAEGASDILRLNLVRGDLELGKGVL